MSAAVAENASPGGSPTANGWKNYLLLLQENAPKPAKVANLLGIIPSCPEHYGIEFHGLITREDANRLLANAGEGAYLVRASARAPNAFTLCLRWDSSTKNYKLYYDGQHFVGEKRFNTLEDLVADGLIHMYVEKHAAEYIKRMTDDIVYEESPYSEYQRRVALERKQARRRFIQRRKLLNRASPGSASPTSGMPVSSEGGRGAGDGVRFEEGASDQSIDRSSDRSSDETRSSSIGIANSSLPNSHSPVAMSPLGRSGTIASNSSDHECTQESVVNLSQKVHKWNLHTWRAGGSWCDFCRNWMWGLIQQGYKCGDCGFAAHQRCTERVLPDCRPDLKYVKRMFAVDLTTLTMAHQCDIPPVVERCVVEIERRGLKQNGLYRVPGFHDEVDSLRIKFDTQNSVDLSLVENIHSVASLLKLYFRLLPVPLITYSCYHAIISVAKTPANHETRLHMIASCLRDGLPKSHLVTLQFLINHLSTVVSYCDFNQMPSENLARIFAPSLMRNPDPVDALAMAEHEQFLIAQMITNVNEIFS